MKPSTLTHARAGKESGEGVKTAQTNTIEVTHARTLIHRIDM
jgi:hypothetical protein